MAYMSQEKKKALAPSIKAVLKKYGMKGTIAVNHYSTLVVNIREGKLDVLENWEQVQAKAWRPEDEKLKKPDYLDVNPYCIVDQYTGEIKDFLLELKAAMMAGNHDNSDIMTDYFDVGWYIDINIGNWEKPYKITT